MISPGGKILKFEYNEGKIVKIEDNIGRTACYEYEGEEAFSYDNAGNRLTKTVEDPASSLNKVTNYYYDNRNRLLGFENIEDKILGKAERVDFEYDLQGNLLFEKKNNGVNKYTYDSFNRNIGVENADRTYIKNYYDPEGMRSEINENGVRSKFIFDRGSIVTEIDNQNNLKNAIIRGYDLVSQMDNKGSRYYYLNNAHGDVMSLTDDNGGIINSYRYDAFGNMLEANEQVNNRFKYCGE